MSVSSSQTYTVAIQKSQLKDVLSAIALSPITFEALNPADLGQEWKNVHFIQSEKSHTNEIKTLQSAIDIHQPTGMLAGLMDNRVDISVDDLALAESSTEYILDLAHKLIEYNTAKTQLQSKRTSTEFDSDIKSVEKALEAHDISVTDFTEESVLDMELADHEEVVKKLTYYQALKEKQTAILSGQYYIDQLQELTEYFSLRQVNPDSLSEEHMRKIVALYTVFENAQKVKTLSEKVFTTDESAETAFVFTAVKSTDMPSFEELLTSLQTTFEQITWTQEIVTWESAGGLKSFQMVAQSLGTIGTREVDPSPVVAVMWMTFFAFAFGDALYATIIAGITGYLYFFRKLKPGIKNFMFLFFISSVATILFGMLTNSWGSDFLNSDFVKTILGTPDGQNTFLHNAATSFQVLDLGLADEPNANLSLNKVVDSLDTQPVVFLLGVSAIVGFVALLTGYLLKALNSLKQGNTANFIEDMNWFVFAVSAPVAIMGLATDAPWANAVLATLAVLLLGFFVFNSGKGIIGKIIGGFGKVYGVISFASDTISFTRLAAVGLTATIIGFVINLMAGLVMGDEFSVTGLILGIIVLIIGHGLNFVLAVFAAYINPLRLHYVEFMPKFYQGEARALQPTIQDPSYARIIAEQK